MLLMGEARLVKVNLPGWAGSANLYAVDPPMWSFGGDKLWDHVVLSTARVPYSGPETYIFGADSTGKVTDFRDLPGSARGEYEDADILSSVGYVIK